LSKLVFGYLIIILFFSYLCASSFSEIRLFAWFSPFPSFVLVAQINCQDLSLNHTLTLGYCYPQNLQHHPSTGNPKNIYSTIFLGKLKSLGSVMVLTIYITKFLKVAKFSVTTLNIKNSPEISNFPFVLIKLHETLLCLPMHNLPMCT